MLSRLAPAPRLAAAAAAARSLRPAIRPPPLAFISSSSRRYGKPPATNPSPKQACASTPPSSGAAAPHPAQKPADQSSQKPPTAADASTSQSGGLDDGAVSAKDKNVADAPQEPVQTPFHKLPDLTQGIPSTLEQELERQSGRSPSSLQALEQEDISSGGRGGGGSGASYVSTSDRNRRWWARFMLLSSAVGCTVGIIYMGREWDDEAEAKRHPDIPNGWSARLWWQRVRARMGESVSYYQDPAFEHLLPDPDPSFERPYTLCLSLDDLLIHSEWSREHGWRIAKRPGVDYFIRYLSQYYELVLFTTVPFAMGEPLVRKLDPFRFIMWPLYREATKYEDGELVKDLSYLNRDLSKVIILDTNPAHVRKQPENAIILKPWTGDAKDKDLVGLIPFLEYIHTMQYSDVRKVIKSFEGKHIPTEFARREAIARREFTKKLEAERAKHSKPSIFGALGSLLGLKPGSMTMTVTPDGEQNPSEAFAQGKMLQDIARERGQRNYELLEKEIRQNGEKWLKEEQVAMEKAQQEVMNSMMGSFSGWFVPAKEAEAAAPAVAPAEKP